MLQHMTEKPHKLQWNGLGSAEVLPVYLLFEVEERCQKKLWGGGGGGGGGGLNQKPSEMRYRASRMEPHLGTRC